MTFLPCFIAFCSTIPTLYNFFSTCDIVIPIIILSMTQSYYFLYAACSGLSNPSNGDVSFSSSTLSVGTTATYSCDSRYLLTGSSFRTCLSSGEWSGYAPYCKFTITSNFKLTPEWIHVAFVSFCVV